MLFSPFSPLPLDQLVHYAEPPEEPVRPADAMDASQFSAAELRIIGFAEESDARCEIPAGGWFRRSVEWVLGIRTHRPLADPRLESLRVGSLLARHYCESVVEADMTRLVDAGFSREQVQGLFDCLMSRCRNARSRPMPPSRAIGYCGPELG